MRYYCNPLNLPYKYQYFRRVSQGMTKAALYREAADPSLVLFKGNFFLFPSMTAGYFVSGDLVDWQFHEFRNEMPLYGYAPDVCVVGDYLYFCASRIFEPYSFYRTKNPLTDAFERIDGSFPFWDPNMFLDDDERLYFYWGCSSEQPIFGVELDRETLKPLTDPIPLLQSDRSARGFERVGDDHNDPLSSPFIEGAWMTKHDRTYYLQYAVPGTEFNIYADSVFVSDRPLGPFRLAKNNPFSYKPGGFIRGAGHGSTAMDKKGRYWHVSSSTISVNDPFERRLGLWKAGFDQDGELFCDQRYGDFPVSLEAPAFAKPEWMLLSYGKKVFSTGGTGAEFVTDENIRTWWTGRRGDSLTVDLGKPMDVHAIQINFADQKMLAEIPLEGSKNPYWERFIEVESGYTRWLLEGSSDGIEYRLLCDKRNVRTDLPHDFLVWDRAEKIQFVRLTILDVPHGNPCVSGIRVFGKGGHMLPEPVKELSIQRLDDLDIEVSWSGNAVGYALLWGHSPDKLYHSCLVFGKSRQRIGALIKGQDAYVRVDSFNESGISEGIETRLV